MRETPATAAWRNSFTVFQALQSGHCPAHLLNSLPHALQKKDVFVFATFDSRFVVVPDSDVVADQTRDLQPKTKIMILLTISIGQFLLRLR
jgi:hypothetical protein